jgi:outer membrane protein assembly factor BamA
VGGDSDVGIGGGYIASLARVEPNIEPYLWRVESAGTITFKPEGGSVAIPFFDDYLLLALPHVIRDTLGLKVRLSYTHESQLAYFGLGNASVVQGGREKNDPYFLYTWTHPRIEANLEYKHDAFRLASGVAYTENRLTVPADSLLREDSQSPDDDVRRLTSLAPRHGVAVFSLGVGWDDRDNEVSPERGGYHTLRLDLAPSITDHIPYQWLRLNLSLRQHVTLIADRLVVAGRIVVDSLAGQPPFYELARYDNTYAIGGGKGVRGIPARRYHGMLKVFSNLELRFRVVTFDLFDKPHRLAVVGFMDTGRVWADYHRLSDLDDGGGLGLKRGFGGGLRVGAGKSFVLRADVAASPDEPGVSAYLAAGQAF